MTFDKTFSVVVSNTLPVEPCYWLLILLTATHKHFPQTISPSKNQYKYSENVLIHRFI